MRAEQRGTGLRQRVRATWPDTERIMTMTTKFIRFTEKARAEPQLRFNALMGLLYEPQGLHASFERQNGKKAPGVDGIRKVDYEQGTRTGKPVDGAVG